MIIQSGYIRLTCILLASLAGCGIRSSTLKGPEWDATSVAEHAIADYDSNHDGNLSRDELQKCPGLNAAFSRFDSDANGSISASELSSTLKEIHDLQSALVGVTCLVSHGGQPLSGATVTFVPETCMGETLKPTSGVSDAGGVALPSIPDEELPSELRGKVKGIRCGIYRVTVSHPQVQVPPKFSTQTELGWVVAPRSHEQLIISF